VLAVAGLLWYGVLLAYRDDTPRWAEPFGPGLPDYPGSRQIEVIDFTPTAYTRYFATDDTLEAVVGYYNDVLLEKGWVLDERTTAEEAIFAWRWTVPNFYDLHISIQEEGKSTNTGQARMYIYMKRVDYR
jgi:hypothetical protein